MKFVGSMSVTRVLERMFNVSSGGRGGGKGSSRSVERVFKVSGGQWLGVDSDSAKISTLIQKPNIISNNYK